MKLKRGFIQVSSSIALCLLVSLPAAAQSSSSAAISQGFQTKDPDIRAGAIVSFERGTNTRVQLTNRDRVSQMAGVASDKALIALSSGSSETQVVTQGIAPILVSTVNGDIKAGDPITASPINGIGMKATESTLTIGTAQEDLLNKKAQEITVTDSNKHSQKVRVATILAQINITYFEAPSKTQSFLPAFLQQMADGIAGREVPALRVVIGLLVLLVGVVGAGILLYSSVKSSIMSIGRNPLSEGAVRKSLFQVGFIAVGVLLIATVATYLVLTV